MNPATHIGECQVCGATQKLPNGKLSKHGYSVRWGFFDGVCSGAEELPFEVSKNVVEAAILSALAKKEKALDFAKKLRDPATEPKAWFHYYDRRIGAYSWREVDLFAPEGEWRPHGVTFKLSGDADSAVMTVARHGYVVLGGEKNLLEVATFMNAEPRHRR